ncbi:MAG: SMC family ATPase [Nanoarchaeota archaeon]|nr:MAG: SMC family ATPase [Nanoarchaeota archaeon]
MLLKSIKLRNIRSYTSQTINFSKGSTLLSGDIGAGKSSVLLAIEFALFGIIRGQLDGERLLRHGADKGEVELFFKADENEVRITRALKRVKDEIRQDSGKLEVNGNIFVGTPIELKSRILEILGYPKEALTRNKSLIYRFTVYTPQEDMQKILTEDSEARKETLRTVFGVDRYSRAADNAKILIRYLREERRYLSAKTDGIEAEELQLKIKKSRLSGLQDHAREIDEKIEAIKSQIKEKQKKKTELERNAELTRKIANETAGLQSKLDSKKESLTKNSAGAKGISARISGAKAELDLASEAKKPEIPENLEEEIEKNRNIISRLQTERALAGQELKNLSEKRAIISLEVSRAKKKISELPKMIKDLEDSKKLAAQEEQIRNESNEVKKEITEIQRNLGEHEAMQRHSESVLENVSKNHICPLCKNKIDDSHRHQITYEETAKLEESKEQVSNGKKKLASLSEKLVELDLRNDKIISIISSMKGLMKDIEDINDLKSETEAKESTINEIGNRIEQLNKKLAAQTEKKETETLQKLIELKKKGEGYILNSIKRDQLKKILLEFENQEKELQEESLSLNKETEILEKQLAENKIKLAEFEQIEMKISAEIKGIDSLQQAQTDELVALGSIKKEIDVVSSEINTLDETLEQKRKLRSKEKRISSLVQWLDEVAVKSFEIMERQVLGRVYYEFNEMLRAWFSMLMEDETINCRLSADFSPIIEQNGYESQIETLSGGERTSVALAYRLALNRVINDLISTIKTKDLLILDEPTDGFSAEQLDRMKHVLEELNLSQIIIVSHEQKIESFVDNIVRVSKSQHQSVTIQ